MSLHGENKSGRRKCDRAPGRHLSTAWWPRPSSAWTQTSSVWPGPKGQSCGSTGGKPSARERRRGLVSCPRGGAGAGPGALCDPSPLRRGVRSCPIRWRARSRPGRQLSSQPPGPGAPARCASRCRSRSLSPARAAGRTR